MKKQTKVNADVRVTGGLKTLIQEIGEQHNMTYADMFRTIVILGITALKWFDTEKMDIKSFMKKFDSFIEVLEEKE